MAKTYILLFLIIGTLAHLRPHETNSNVGLTLDCVDEIDCQKKLIEIWQNANVGTFIANLQSILKSNNQPQSSMSDFITGLFVGMQQNPSAPSACVESLQEISAMSDPVFQSAKEMILQVDVEKFFSVAFATNNLLAHLAIVVENCKFRVLTQGIWNLMSAKGAQLLITRMAITYAKLITDWTSFNENLALGEYLDAGQSLGDILTIILGFSI